MGLNLLICSLHFWIAVSCHWNFDTPVELGMVSMQWVVLQLGYPFEKRFVLPTFVGDFNKMPSYSHLGKEESLSLAFWGICASCRTFNYFKLPYSGWKFDKSRILNSSTRFFAVSVLSLVDKMLLTSISSISIGCNFPMKVFLGMCIVLYSVLNRDMFSNFGYLLSILWSITKG